MKYLIMFLFLTISSACYAGSGTSAAIGGATGAIIATSVMNQQATDRSNSNGLRIELCKTYEDINQQRACLTKIQQDNQKEDDEQAALFGCIILLVIIILFGVWIFS